MKTILVPVDFSATARNCALYAAGLAHHLGASKLVLFNAYSIPLATEMSWAVLQAEELKTYSTDGLNSFKKMVEPVAGNNVAVETISDFGFLSDSIEAVAKQTAADLIVMGITGGGKLEEVLVGSNTTHILKNIRVPLLIVPAGATWKPVETLGWACDYKNILQTAPITAIKQWANYFTAKLVIVHNDADSQHFDADKATTNNRISEMLNGLPHEFAMVCEKDFGYAMNHFVASHHIDLLLIVPKKHSWFDAIFHRSHTTQLAFHSHVPLLCLQEQQHTH